MIKLRHTLFTALVLLGVSSVNAQTITVYNTNASGPGSLNQAILDANASSDFSTIEFNIPGTGDRIINGTDFPAFTAPVLVTTSGNQNGRTVIDAPIINGAGALTTGFTFEAQAHNSTVQFVTFKDFVLSIVIKGGEISVINNTFENNIGGVDVRLIYGPASFIKGNTFTGRGYAIAGIGSGSRIIGNTFNNESISMGGGGGLIIGGANSGEPNIFNNISGNAIDLSSMNGCTIYGNTINGSTLNGISLQGVDNLISANKISGVKDYDIVVKKGWYNRITNNKVTGDNNIFNGILIQKEDADVVTGNTVTGGAIELDTVTSSNRGPLTISNNRIENDPMGFSGHGALTLSNVSGAYVSFNEILSNAGQGVYLSQSSNNTIINNSISNNGRVGIYVYQGNNNKLTKNTISNNHADAGGGRTGIFLNNANANKTAPVLTSAKRVGQNFVITGTGALANDTLEFFLSDRVSKGSNLTQNAIWYQASVKVIQESWTATIPVGSSNSAEVYFIATATSGQNTSMFSNTINVELNGPTSATTNHGSTYFAEFIPGASYSFWSTLPISSVTQSGNSATFNFNQVGSGTVSVGYSDPVSGQWKMYSIAVTVYGPAKVAANGMAITTADVYPNPFSTSTNVKIEGTMGADATVNIYNLNGELVFSSNGHKEGEVVEVGSSLENGIYSVKVIAGNDMKTSKIVKVY